MASLFMVATPIGNLGDITIRALETLRAAEVIACEDTRHTRKLLSHYEISRPVVSVRSENEQEGALRLIGHLKEGKDVAYVTDAGTPGVSDPGRRIVEAVRRESIPVVPIPGPSALTAILSASSFPGRAVTFDGFISPKAGKRAKRISELLSREEAFIFYESPHRVLKILKEVAEKEPERPVLVAREMTKIYEEFVEGTAEEVYADFAGRKSLKGEFSLLVSGKKKR
mgnify:CR=1 FL=1